MKAKILVESANADSYVATVAAIVYNFPDMKEIMFSFMKGEKDESFLNAVQTKLSNLSSDQIYAKAARLHIEGEKGNENDPNLFKDWSIIDVTAVSKERAINIAASGVDIPNAQVCILSWKESFRPGEIWLVKKDNHKYSNLFSEGALHKLYKNHYRKKQVLYMFSCMFILLFGASFGEIIWPSFVLTDKFISLFSLTIGFTGLWLSWLSLKRI